MVAGLLISVSTMALVSVPRFWNWHIRLAIFPKAGLSSYLDERQTRDARLVDPGKIWLPASFLPNMAMFPNHWAHTHCIVSSGGHWWHSALWRGWLKLWKIISGRDGWAFEDRVSVTRYAVVVAGAWANLRGLLGHFASWLFCNNYKIK